jgi:hypothetical protein
LDRHRQAEDCYQEALRLLRNSHTAFPEAKGGGLKRRSTTRWAC